MGLLSQNSVTKVAMMASWYHNASQSFRPMPKGAYASEASGQAPRTDLGAVRAAAAPGQSNFGCHESQARLWGCCHKTLSQKSL